MPSWRAKFSVDPSNPELTNLLDSEDAGDAALQLYSEALRAAGSPNSGGADFTYSIQDGKLRVYFSSFNDRIGPNEFEIAGMTPGG